MAITDLTNLSDVTNFYELTKYDNDITSGLLGYGFLMVFFVVIFFIALRKYDDEPEKAFMAASFVTFGISLIEIAIQLINFWWVLVFGLLWVGSVFWVWMANRSP